MRTPTAVSAGRLARCLSLRSLAGLGRLVALLLGEAAPDAVDLPGPSARTRDTGPDRAARRSPSPRPPAPAICPWTRSGRTDRDRRTGRRQAATTCLGNQPRHLGTARGQLGGCLVTAPRARLRPARTTANSKREIMHRFALLPWGDENFGPSRRGGGPARAGVAVVRVAVAGAEGAQWWRRAACRHCSRLDRSRP